MHVRVNWWRGGSLVVVATGRQAAEPGNEFSKRPLPPPPPPWDAVPADTVTTFCPLVLWGTDNK
jgi:hypothetical protein